MADNDENANASTGADILANKVSRALEVRTDTAAMKAALEALAHLPVIDSRSVRVAIEEDALAQALSMQEELQNLVNTVQDLRRSVTETASIAREASASVQDSTSTSGATSSEAKSEESSPEVGGEEELAAQLARAFEERNQARERAQAVDEFLNKFDLSQNESLLLDQYGFDDLDTRGMQFLEALDRVRTIRHELSKTFGTDIEIQGGTDSVKQSLGATSAIRMMESLASKQERAYERLYQWLQIHLNLQEQSQQPQQPVDADALDEALCLDFVKRSLYCLKMDVPAFYSHLIEMIATSRRSEETRRFLLALTSGYNGMPPIEVKAHDPVNYVGDMLAHVFCSYNVEADVARSLVEYKPPHDEDEVSTPSSSDKDTDMLGGEKPMSAAQILAHAMSGVSRPLKSRILQVIASLAKRPQHQDGDQDEIDHSDSLEDELEQMASRSRVSSLYSICGLLLFYHSAFSKAMDKLSTDEDRDEQHESPLVTAVLECLEEGSQAYAASIRVHGATLESLTMISGESEASLAHNMMTEITEVRKASPGFSADLPCPSGATGIEVSLSLEFLCETLVEAALSSCKSLDDAVSIKSSMLVVQKAGLKEEVTNRFNRLISDKEQALIDALVEDETKQVLELVGLGSLLVAWTRMQQVHVEGMTLASQPGLSPPEVQTCIREFYASLYSPPIPSFDSVIKDPILRKRAQSQIAARVANVYEELYLAMHSEKGGYDDLDFLGHSPTQVRTLFSV